MELFFSREGEKSAIVREHRDLLIGVHRHVAWIIHGEAEKGETSGRMSETRLKQVVRDFLANDEHDPAIAERLFTGMIDRVVALVSRVQGTYEFEVQPLREYFAARYLYDTAPYSPLGAERTGTKPDRFEALARNFYWLNVTRFYAGCYSKGELASLIDGLKLLMTEEPFKYLVYPLYLTLLLLTDWVFAQHPRSAKEIARLLFDQNSVRLLLAQRNVEPDTLRVGDNAARQELLDICWELLESNDSSTEWRRIALLMRNNSEPSETRKRWMQNMDANPRIERWLCIGSILGHLGDLPEDSLLQIADATDFGQCEVVATDRPELVDRNEMLRQTALQGLLRGEVLSSRRGEASTLIVLSSRLEPYRYALAFHEKGPNSLAMHWRQFHFNEDKFEALSVPGLENASSFIQMTNDLAQRSTSEWATSLEPWSTMVEHGRQTFGDCWALYRIAAISAGIRSTTPLPEDCAELVEDGINLCGRARYARLRAGNPTWWESRLREIPLGDKQLFALLLLFGWGSMRTLGRMAAFCTDLVQGLKTEDWLLLHSAVRILGAFVPGRDERTSSVQLPVLNSRLVALIIARVGPSDRYALYRRSIRDASPGAEVIQTVLPVVIEAVVGGASGSDVEADLDFIRRSHCDGVRSDYPSHRLPSLKTTLDIQLALRICKAAMEYPVQLLTLAQERVQSDITFRPVLSVAEDDAWFE